MPPKPSARLTSVRRRNLRARWADADKRSEIIQALAERGISFEELAEQSKQPDADPVRSSLPSGFQRAAADAARAGTAPAAGAQGLLREVLRPEARQILDELLEKYAEHGDAQFVLPDVLHVPPISGHGQPGEIIRLFGGPDQLRQR